MEGDNFNLRKSKIMECIISVKEIKKKKNK